MNAVKHASPSRIEVALELKNGILSLTISDDGRGISMAREKTGLGLEIMRNRAALIEGALEIVAGDPGGTTVTCRRRMEATGGAACGSRP